MNIYELIDQMTKEHKSIFDMPLNVTFYARVSTHREEQLNSQENQIQTFTEMIQRNPRWTLVEGYIDTIRGESAANRDSFQRMIDDAKAGKFDLIICKEISRFSRDLLDSISYTRDLFKNNVGVFFTADNLCTIDRDSELRLGIMASIAQQEVARLSERVKFGHKKSIENGTVMGNSRIYGYNKKNGKLVIDPKEAEMVKLIYELYATGDYSLHTISDALLEKGYRNHNGNPFAHTTIKAIIQNPKNKGYYCGNKVRVLDYRTKKQKFLPEDQWIMYKDETGEIVPAIVTEDLWNRCNEMLKKRSVGGDSGNKGAKRFTSPLSGKIVCAYCNKNYHHDSYGHGTKTVKWHWICQNKKLSSKNCPSFSIKEEEILSVLKTFFQSFISNMDIYIERYTKLYQEQFSESSSSNSIEQLKRDVFKLEQKKDKLLDLYSEDLITKTEFKEKNDALNEQILRLNEEIATISNRKNNLQSILDEMDQFKKYFNTNRAETMSDSFALELSKTIIEKIIIDPQSSCTANIIIIPRFGDKYTSDYSRTLPVRSNGHITKKMVESYENSAK